MMEEKYYSISQASQLLGLKVRTVREWIHLGKLKAIKYDGCRLWHIPESEIKRVTSGAANGN